MGGCAANNVFWKWHCCCTDELTIAVAVCPRPTKIGIINIESWMREVIKMLHIPFWNQCLLMFDSRRDIISFHDVETGNLSITKKYPPTPAHEATPAKLSGHTRKEGKKTGRGSRGKWVSVGEEGGREWRRKSENRWNLLHKSTMLPNKKDVLLLRFEIIRSF